MAFGAGGREEEGCACLLVWMGDRGCNASLQERRGLGGWRRRAAAWGSCAAALRWRGAAQPPPSTPLGCLSTHKAAWSLLPTCSLPQAPLAPLPALKELAAPPLVATLSPGTPARARAVSQHPAQRSDNAARACRRPCSLGSCCRTGPHPPSSWLFLTPPQFSRLTNLLAGTALKRRNFITMAVAWCKRRCPPPSRRRAPTGCTCRRTPGTTGSGTRVGVAGWQCAAPGRAGACQAAQVGHAWHACVRWRNLCRRSALPQWQPLVGG